MAIFWTIQTLTKWEQFKTSGLLLAEVEFAEPLYLRAYEWMMKAMNRKMSNSFQAVLPIWCWYRYSAEKARPDLRRRGYLTEGGKGMLIEFEESFDNVLLTDFDEWHMVLNCHDDLEYEAETTIISEEEKYPWKDIIVNPPDDERIPTGGIQGTTWGVRMDQVRSVTPFTARFVRKNYRGGD